jgi:enoyl-CoA hydratase
MISREDIPQAAVVRLAHGKVSALDVGFCDALVTELQSIAESSARTVIVTGSGSTFSAGVDLFQVLNGGAEYLSRFLPAMEALFRTLLTFPKPMIVAVNGHAIAGGCIVAACGDFRVMADGSSRIGVPELRVGVPFPALPFEIVRARVSPARFRHLVMSGRTTTASEAVALGLIDEAVPPEALLARAQQAAEQLANIPPIAFALTKRAFVDAVLERVDRAPALNDAVLEAWAHPDVQARMRAYVDQAVGKK